MAVPKPKGVLETALYVDDRPRSIRFFRDVMGLAIVHGEARLTAFDAGGSSRLLVFPRGESTYGENTPAGHIPGHDGEGPLHMAFKIAEADYEPWRTHLRAAGVPEIATPGLWPSYQPG